VIASSKYIQQLKRVKFFFGAYLHPPAKYYFGEFCINKTTYPFNKSDVDQTSDKRLQ